MVKRIRVSDVSGWINNLKSHGITTFVFKELPEHLKAKQQYIGKARILGLIRPVYKCDRGVTEWEVS